jgi:transposase
MVAAVRAGSSQRAVAGRFGVPVSVVQRWVVRAGDQPLEAVEWRDRSRQPHHSPRRSRPEVEAQVLALRETLRQESDLGEYGAAAIAAALTEAGAELVPSVRTINRILSRNGAFDGRQRVRRPAPPLGWQLPAVAQGQVELDAFDTITDLVIEGGQPVAVLTGVSLHGGLVGCWPLAQLRTVAVRAALESHWRTFGCPGYAQFDNDTLFQGPHQHADAIGTVTRLCLSLGVTPVFTPPRETGFQAAVESLNYRWQQAVWARWHHPSLEALQVRSARSVAAVRQKRQQRREAAPERHPISEDWQLDLQARPQGLVIFLRRTDEGGWASLLGHRFPVDPHWLHRLVRAEVSLPQGPIRFFALRRREPAWQPLLQEVPYSLPSKSSLR